MVLGRLQKKFRIDLLIDEKQKYRWLNGMDMILVQRKLNVEFFMFLGFLQVRWGGDTDYE